MKKNKTFYVTTPIYYPSGNLHIGHAYTTTLAWVLKNYKMKDGFDVKMLTGADEHGQKIEQKALENHLKPQAYVDLQAKKFKLLWDKLSIDYDYFSRTTSEKHIHAVQKQFSFLLQNGDIYKDQYNGWYSISDEEFLTPKQAIEKNGELFHPVSGDKLVNISEESYFLKINKYQKWLQEYIKNNHHFIFPHKIVNELEKNFFDKGLENLSISRSTFKWGIPIIEDQKHVIYVWLDALNNYITALGYNQEDNKDYLKYWANGDEIVHIVGKEIARFHCIYWPIILKANDLRLPSSIISHGWIITSEGKMSKSKGNVIDPLNLIEKFGAETLKFFLASQIPIGNDGIFEEEILKNIFNSHLVNNYGNLVSRTLALYHQNFNEPIKYLDLHLIDKKIFTSIENHFQEYKTFFDAYKIDQALSSAIQLSSKLNKYIDETMPWKLKNDKKRLSTVLNALFNGIYAVSTMLSVVMPQKTDIVRKAFKMDDLSFEKVLDFKKFDEKIFDPINNLFERIK